ADIDLECFVRPGTSPLTEQEQWYGRTLYGRGGEYESLVDFGKAMWRDAADSTLTHPWQPTRARPEIQFHETQVPEDGSSLWAYGTPGERYYVGWVWHRRGGITGRLQIDIAEAGSYELTDISVANVQFVAPGERAFECP